jgi:hypothetical protein
MASRWTKPATALARRVVAAHWSGMERVAVSASSFLASKIQTAPSSILASRNSYSTTSVAAFHSEFNDEEEPLGPNPGLESVISQGMTSLERTASEVQTKTKKTSLSASAPKKSLTTPRQLAESQRILDVATDCLEALCERDAQNLLAIGGEPLVLLDVQVNSNAKLAKVFWTLPYGILTDERLTPTAYRTLMAKMQGHFEKGAGKVLAQQVHTRLRSYYPPRLKFHPAPPNMVAQAMGEVLEE